MKQGYDPQEYERMNHIIGRITLPAGFVLTFLPLFVLWRQFGVTPEWLKLLEGIFSISVLMAPVSIVEVLTFTAMLGSGAMYMAYLTGNITNLKIPSAAMALEVCEVSPASEEGEILSTIAIAGSVIISEIIIVAGVLLIGPLTEQLQHPTIQPAFTHILPALFGAIGAFYVLKEWKVAVAPLLVAVLLNLAGELPTALTIPLCVAV
ncbi:MAG: hypothetical protein ACOCZA_05420, partial [Spirochaetota bacterium]